MSVINHCCPQSLSQNRSTRLYRHASISSHRGKATSNLIMAQSLPKTMKAAVLTKASSPLEIKDVPMPQIQEGEILIKVHACGVCHSDAHVMNGDMGPP